MAQGWLGAARCTAREGHEVSELLGAAEEREPGSGDGGLSGARAAERRRREREGKKKREKRKKKKRKKKKRKRERESWRKIRRRSRRAVTRGRPATVVRITGVSDPIGGGGE
ncbi:hypothetical protein PVAP13_5KG357614 [Panicum virgatum]|uniref:Uncharacterized protein n=1 Tax=Panicum virgatum TaxID=38727 RepID=A0A8T0SQH7_PANVG|nr:hypothetical protein PVAP13_5KG357614 [Panicum virgatum]